MKKIIKVIALLMVLALAVSMFASLADFGGDWFSESSHKHNSSAGNTPPEDENETPEEPDEPDEPLDPSTFTVTLSTDGIATATPYTERAVWELYTIGIVGISVGEVFVDYWAGSSPVDFSQYMEIGKQYAVKVCFVKEFDNEGEFWSEWITYEPASTETLTVCPECDQEYDSAMYAACPNPDCPSNNEATDPMTTCPECNQEYNSETYDACPNENCPSKDSTEIKCPDCNNGYLSEGSGTCSNPDCPSNNEQTYTVTLSADGLATCSPSDFPEANYHLYRVTDGTTEEVSYYGAMGATCDFSEEISADGDYYVVCDVQGFDDDNNMITVATCTSNMITGGNTGTTERLCPECGVGYLSEGTDTCSNPDCISNSTVPDLMTTCPDCGQEYNSETYGSCPNEECPSNTPLETKCPDCDSGYLSEGTGECSNPDCPSYGCPICGDFSYATNDGLCLNCEGKCTSCDVGYLLKETGKCNNPDCVSNTNPTYTVTLSDEGMAICSPSPAVEATYSLYLYYVSNGESKLVATSGAEGGTCNFASEIADAGDGSYYVVCEVQDYDSEGNMVTIATCTSNTITVGVSDSLEILCPDCEKGYLSEGTGACNNPDCPTND